MTSDAQIRAFIDRILRLTEEQDTIGEDIRDIYAEAKSMGFDKTAMGNVVAHLRKVAKKGHDTVAEQGAIFDLYLCAYEGKSPHAPAPARVRENIEQFDPTTGEIIEADVSAKLVETIAAGVQTEVGRAALIAAVDIMIEREERIDAETGEILDDHEASAGTAPAVETSLAAREAEESAVSNSEIATASQGETESPSAEAEAAGANAGGEDVDRSAERADINAVASASGPDEKRATNSPEEAEFHAKASDDACEAGRKALGRAEASAEAPDGAELVSRGVADRAATATSENGRDSLERQAPSSTAKPKYALRPHCLNPGETCGGYGDKHCHGCLKAMREQAEEVA
nr:GapR family DNA-binding domain-containing protein [Sinorhizobium meliloti]